VEQETVTPPSVWQTILEENRRQARDLADIIAALDRMENKFDRMGEQLARIDRPTDSMAETPINWSSLRPLIRAAVVEALREHDAQAECRPTESTAP
jgi:hypothetical protein